MIIQLDQRQADAYRQYLLDQQKQQYAQQGQQAIKNVGATNSIQPSGILGDLLTGITSPIRSLLGMGSKLVGGVVDIGKKFAETGDITRALAESTPIQQQGTGILGVPTMTASENKVLSERPLEYGIGNALNTGSWIVPAGGGATSALGKIAQAGVRGAEMGGLSGLGAGMQADVENPNLGGVLQSGLQGAGMGLAFGAGTQALGQIGKGLLGKVGKTVPKNTTTGVVSTTPPKLSKLGQASQDTADLALIRDFGGSVKPDKGMKLFRNFEDTFGVKTRDLSLKKTQQLVDSTMAKEAPELGKMISGSAQQQIAVKDILQPLKDSASKIKLESSKKAFMAAVTDVEKSLGKTGSVSVETANTIRQNVGSKAADVWNEIAKTGGSGLQPMAKAYTGIYDSLRTNIDNALINAGYESTVVKSLNQKVSNALSMQQYMTKVRNTAMPKSAVTGVDMMLGGFGISNPSVLAALGVKKGIETPGAQRLIARGLAGLDKLTTKTPTIPTANIAQGVQEGVQGAVQNPLLGKLGGLAQKGITRQAIGIPQLGMQQTNPNMEQSPYDESTFQLPSYFTYQPATPELGVQGDLTGQLGQQPIMTYQDAYNMAIQQYGATTRSEANTIANSILSAAKTAGTGGGKQLPAGSLLKLADAENAITLLDNLEQTISENKDLFGPITGRLRAMNPWDTKASVQQSMQTAVNQIVGKAMEGGVLRAEDTAKYLKILAQVGDTPEAAIDKVRQLRKQLASNYAGIIKSYQRGGYDPYAGSGADSSISGLENTLQYGQ